MSTYKYTALDSEDKLVRDTISAISRSMAISKLEKSKLTVINATRQQQSRNSLLFASRVTRLDKIVLTRHLVTLLGAGVGLDQALKIAAEQTEKIKFREVLTDLCERITRGEALHSALSNHPRYFSDFYVNLIKVGEKSGTLDTILLHLLKQQEQDYDLIVKTRSALMYPAVVIAAAITVVVLMLALVIPNITSLLIEYNVVLPLSTRVIIFLSNILTNYGIGIAFGLVAILFALKKLVGTKKGKIAFDTILLKTPIVQQVVVEFNLARICRSMYTLVESGVVIDQALELASPICRNYHYRRTLMDAVATVRRGVAITEAFKNDPKLYPPITTRMLEIGESTGKLGHMFNQLANFYEQSVLTKIKNISSIIEPVLLVLIGLAVCFLAVSVLMPIWTFTETI